MNSKLIFIFQLTSTPTKDTFLLKMELLLNLNLPKLTHITNPKPPFMLLKEEEEKTNNLLFKQLKQETLWLDLIKPMPELLILKSTTVPT